MTEYALLAALIAVAGIVSISSLSRSIHDKFCYIGSEIAGGGEATEGEGTGDLSDACAAAPIATPEPTPGEE